VEIILHGQDGHVTGKPSMSLEILHFSLVLFRGGSRRERAEVPAFAGAGIQLARIEAILAG